jgi:hypothetical protein
MFLSSLVSAFDAEHADTTDAGHDYTMDIAIEPLAALTPVVDRYPRKTAGRPIPKQRLLMTDRGTAR